MAGLRRPEVERLERVIARLTDQQEALGRELKIQFERIAQLQADFDLIRATWAKMKPARHARR